MAGMYTKTLDYFTDVIKVRYWSIVERQRLGVSELRV